MTSAPLGPRTPWSSVAISFLVIGAGLRLLEYVSAGQLYVDDASVALNIASRSFSALTRPLDYGQAAPIAFLWLEKLATQVGGTNDHALRALPLLASIAGLFLMWSVGRRALGEEPAVLATCLAAFSTFLITFAGAVKQYSSDALVTLLLVWLVLAVMQAPDDRRAWRRLLLGGAAALWISHTAVFVLAGAALALPVEPAVRAAPRWSRRYALMTIAWAALFAATYLLVYRVGEKDPFLKDIWDWTFLTPGAPDFAARTGRAVRAALVPPVWTGGMVLGTPLVLGGWTGLAFLAGLVAIFRARGASFTLLCVGPYAAAFGAAMIGQYPLADRFLLFAAPLLFFIYGSALWWAATAFPPRARPPAIAAALVLLTLCSYPAALEEGAHPKRRRETKALLQTVNARAPDAPVYLLTPRFSCVCTPWTLYTTDWSAPDTARLRRFVHVWRGPLPPGRTEEVGPAHAESQSFRVGRREELIGAAANTPYVVPVAHSPPPDPAWVERESDRIRSAANPTAWLWVSEPFPETVITALLHGISQRGGRLIFASRVLGATAWEVEFPAGSRMPVR